MGRGRDQVLHGRRQRVPDHRGTGTEDYFCGAYNFDPGSLESAAPARARYQEFTTPYAGLPQVIRPDGVYQSQQRFGLYRWHVMDPVRFEQDLRGHDPGARLAHARQARYLPLQDDIASVRVLVPDAADAPFPALPHRDQLEVI